MSPRSIRMWAAFTGAFAACSAGGAGGDVDVARSADAAPPSDTGAPSLDGPPLRADSAGSDATPLDAGADVGPDAADAGPWRLAARGACAVTYSGPVERGLLADPALVEVSGLVASPGHPGVLWMHNDSGDIARLYAVDANGGRVGRLILTDVEALDFEDIAAGPCPDGAGPCLWVADTGDNVGERAPPVVYVVREPDDVSGDHAIAPTWVLPFHFPGGSVDAEALAVAPDASTFYLFEKVDADTARVFAYPGPLRSGHDVELERLFEIASPGFPIDRGRMITAADLHPSGRRLLLRVYTGTYEYRFGAGQGIGDLPEIEPIRAAVGPLSESQGESVGYDAAGTGFWTVSESLDAEPGEPLHHYACRAEGD